MKIWGEMSWHKVYAVILLALLPLKETAFSNFLFSGAVYILKNYWGPQRVFVSVGLFTNTYHTKNEN